MTKDSCSSEAQQCLSIVNNVKCVLTKIIIIMIIIIEFFIVA